MPFKQFEKVDQYYLERDRSYYRVDKQEQGLDLRFNAPAEPGSVCNVRYSRTPEPNITAYEYTSQPDSTFLYLRGRPAVVGELAVFGVAVEGMRFSEEIQKLIRHSLIETLAQIDSIESTADAERV